MWKNFLKKKKNSTMMERKNRFYETHADGVFRFKNDGIIKYQKSALAEKSPICRNFLMENPSRKLVKEITNWGYTKIKLFLDCVMDFRDCSFREAFQLLPLAQKYETTDFFKKCVDILEPKTLDENAIFTLNLATRCKCEDLKRKVLRFLKTGRFIEKIFHDETFYLLLEPKSMQELILRIEKDSYVIEIVFKWGCHYLKEDGKSQHVNLRTFFKSNGIRKYLEITGFETTGALFAFNKFGLGKKFYSPYDFEKYFDYFGHEIDHGNCSWVHMRREETLEEELKVKNFALLSDFNVAVSIFRNRIVFYEHSETENMLEWEFDIKVVDSNQREIKYGKMKVAEKIEEVYEKTKGWVIRIDNFHNCMSNLEISVKLTFKYHCRILKRSPKNFFGIESESRDLCFTNVIETKLEKK